MCSSDLSYESLKMVARQVEQWVQRITDGAEAELDAEREKCHANAVSALAQRG